TRCCRITKNRAPSEIVRKNAQARSQACWKRRKPSPRAWPIHRPTATATSATTSATRDVRAASVPRRSFEVDWSVLMIGSQPQRLARGRRDVLGGRVLRALQRADVGDDRPGVVARDLTPVGG